MKKGNVESLCPSGTMIMTVMVTVTVMMTPQAFYHSCNETNGDCTVEPV